MATFLQPNESLQIRGNNQLNRMRDERKLEKLGGGARYTIFRVKSPEPIKAKTKPTVIQREKSWRDTFLDRLGELEGTEGTDKSVEGNSSTRGYGITLIPDSLKDYAATETDDRKLAAAINSYNISQMIADEELDFEGLPDSMKMAAADVMYNTGTLFPNMRQALIDRDYPEALRQTLDIVSANDPDQGDTNKVVRGLINRRMDTYNYSAKELGLPQISDYSVLPSEEEGFLTNITYNFGDAQNPFVFNIDKGMHTKSMTDERPLGYDVQATSVNLQKNPFKTSSIKALGDIVKEKPKPVQNIFATDSLAYPRGSNNVNILGGLESPYTKMQSQAVRYRPSQMQNQEYRDNLLGN
tara:strand:- start:112 stop:1176 length:1065 start_codon:yes stop_codon:yes gene_type:complete